MLLGLDPLLTPDLLHALASAGHADRIAIVDANVPAASTTRCLVSVPGADAAAVLRAVLCVLPRDTFAPDPAPRSNGSAFLAGADVRVAKGCLASAAAILRV